MSMITIITATATEMTAMVTDAAKERQQLRNTACCNCILQGCFLRLALSSQRRLLMREHSCTN
jgi:hypothetical protein